MSVDGDMPKTDPRVFPAFREKLPGHEMVLVVLKMNGDALKIFHCCIIANYLSIRLQNNPRLEKIDTYNNITRQNIS